jgi:hypothetical protein
MRYLVQSYSNGVLVERGRTDDLAEAWAIADKYNPAEVIDTTTNTIVQG